MMGTKQKHFLKMFIFAIAVLVVGIPFYAHADELEENRYADTEFVQEIEEYVKDNAVINQEVVGVNLSEEVFFKGALSSGEEASLSVDEKTAGELDGFLAEAVGNQEEVVDISDYGVSVEDAQTIAVQMLNENPQYFFVDEVCVSYDEKTNEAEGIYLLYSDTAESQSNTYEHVVANILAEVNPKWSDEEKVFFIHDYIVTHCQYDYSTDEEDDYDKFTAYNCLVVGKAVCQGYSLAFKDLCNRLGVKTGFVSSQQVGHGWNLVEIGGRNYYVDTTWDDPSAGTGKYWYEQHCAHTYLLKSQDYFDEAHGSSGQNHYATDIMLDNSTYIRDYYNNKEYDNADWTTSRSPIACVDGGMYYLQSNGKIYKYTGIKNDPVYITEISGRYPVYGMDGYSYNLTYGTILSIEDTVFVNEYNKIYYLDGKTLKPFYTVSSTDLATGYIHGMSANGSVLYCSLASGYMASDYKKTLAVDAKSIVGNVVTSVTLNKTSYSFSEPGQTLQLKATVLPSGLKVDSWTSSDPSVATVSSAGLVTAVKPGVAIITAKAGKKIATCDIAVNSKWQKDFDYTLSTMYGNSITLRLYNGSETNVTVPAHAVIGGVEYYTVIANAGQVFIYNDTVESVEFEEGVLFGTLYGMFKECTALKKVVMNNCDTHNITDASYAFSGCTNLKEVNLKNCNLVNLRFGTDTFLGCKKLKVLYAPQYISNLVNIALPVTMRVKNGTVYGTEDINYLNSAVVGKTLVSLDSIKLTSIKFNPVEVSVRQGDKQKLNVVYTPANAVDIDTVVFSSSNTSVLTVNATSGKITAKKMGTAVVTAATSDGRLKAKCTVTVLPGYDPPALTLKGTDKGISVKWKLNADAGKYRVFRKNGDAWEKLATVTTNSYVDKTAVPGKSYTYTVVLMTSGGVALSDYGTGTKITYQLPAPTVKLASLPGGVKVTWSAMAQADKYRIYRKDDAGKWVKLDTVKDGSMFYTDSAVKSGVSYTYTVVGMTAEGMSLNAYGNGVSITYVKDKTVPAVTLKSVASGVKIYWKSVKIDGLAKYRVLRKNADGTWARLETVSADASVGTYYIYDTSAVSGEVYTYTVICMKANGSKLTDEGEGVSILYQKPVSLPAFAAEQFIDEQFIYRETADGEEAVSGETEEGEETAEEKAAEEGNEETSEAEESKDENEEAAEEKDSESEEAVEESTETKESEGEGEEAAEVKEPEEESEETAQEAVEEKEPETEEVAEETAETKETEEGEETAQEAAEENGSEGESEAATESEKTDGYSE